MSSTSLTAYPVAGQLSEPVANPIRLPHSRIKRSLFIIILSIAGIMLFVILAFHALMAWVLARPTVEPLHSNPQLKLGLSYEDVTIPSANGVTNIEGWFIPAESKRSVVFSHGYGANREEVWVPMYELANELNGQGYNVLMFDYGYALSGGEQLMTGGKQESQELLGAVQFLKDRGMEQVYVWGFSMGAGTALQAALYEPAIDGMILDSTFILNSDTLYHNVKQVVNVPKFPSVPLVQLFSSLLNGVGMKDIPHEQILSRSYQVPIFFIHGDQDHRAPYELVEQIAANQVHPMSNLWIVPDGQHELIFQTRSEAYLEKAFGFLSRLNQVNQSA
jgi:uncharacterized protein